MQCALPIREFRLQPQQPEPWHATTKLITVLLNRKEVKDHGGRSLAVQTGRRRTHFIIEDVITAEGIAR